MLIKKHVYNHARNEKIGKAYVEKTQQKSYRQ